MFKVRTAKSEDIPEILKLLVQVDMVHHNGRPDIFKGPTTKYNAEQLEEILLNKEAPVFVCVNDEGKVTGHAFCIYKQEKDDRVLTDIKTLYIDDICVDENYRRQGVGEALYNYVLEYAKEHGFYNITLNVWNCNSGAMKFYEKMGLKPLKVCMETII